MEKENVKILWLSRHEILPVQRRELQRIFGEVKVDTDTNPFSDASDIIERKERGGYDEIVVVAPLSVIEQLVRRGVKPLWAEMEEVSGKMFNLETDVLLESSSKTRHMRFRRFRRISAIKIEFEDF